MMIQNENFDLAFKVLGFLGVLVGFCVGLMQYRKAQHWKRLEFVAAEVKEFEDDPLVLKAMQILDWNNREINLFDDTPQNRSKWPNVTDDLVRRALLRIPDQRKDAYDDEEVAIRDVFDVFFGYLSRFDNYIESGLVGYGAFDPYLRYWLDIMSNKHSMKKDQEYRDTLREHSEFYFPGVESLLNRYQSARTDKLSLSLPEEGKRK
jgi:hypothetical protein